MSIATKFKNFMSAQDFQEDEEYEMSDIYESDYDEEPVMAYRQPERQSTVQFTKTDNEKVLNMQTPQNKKDYEIIYFSPKSATEAPSIAKAFRDGKLCIINIIELSDIDAQTMADFISGAAFALNGNVKGISEEIFIAIPSSISYRGNFYEDVAKYSNGSGLIR